LDRDAAALRAASANAVGTTIRWAVADAGQLPLAARSVDLVISNPPWGRQVRAGGLLAADPAGLWRELRRALAPHGRAVSLAGSHPAIVTLAPG